jgi:hypothetical protein
VNVKMDEGFRRGHGSNLGRDSGSGEQNLLCPIFFRKAPRTRIVGLRMREQARTRNLSLLSRQA